MKDREQGWMLNVEYATKSQFKKFRKNHPEEYNSCFTNLDKVKSLLDSGHKLKEFQIGFFRSEGGNLYRVGQSGVVAAKESRLYVYPSEAEQKIYILQIGTKETQQQDIKKAKQLIKNIKK